MALLIDTLSKNKSIFNPDQNTTSGSNSNYGIWDLTKSSVSFAGATINIKTIYIVQDYVQMRPDLVAAINMGSQNKVGSLLKINSISNPFSLKLGKVLIVPEDSTVSDIFNINKLTSQAQASSNTNTNPNQVFRKNQEQKKFEVSSGRKKFLQDKIKNQPAMSLPPNVTQPGDQTVIKSNGFIIFAPNSGGGGFNTPVTI